MGKTISLVTTVLMVLLGVIALLSPNVSIDEYAQFLKIVSPLLLTLSGSIGANSIVEKLTNKEDRCGEEE